MADKIPVASKGLLCSLTVLASTLVSIAHTRLELLSSDLEEDRERLLSLLLMALVALFCLGIGVVLATILLVAAFWDTHRLLTPSALVGLFLSAGIVACGFAVRKARTKPRVFTASLSELLKDRQHLESRL
jgi:uncharacterized membrane protein YqjE